MDKKSKNNEKIEFKDENNVKKKCVIEKEMIKNEMYKENGKNEF